MHDAEGGGPWGNHGFPHVLPRVAQLRRAPLLQRGGWGFESLAADMPLRLGSAEQPPCKRTVVGSIPSWGFGVGEPLVPPRAPSSWLPHGPCALGLPAGEAGLRPRR